MGKKKQQRRLEQEQQTIEDRGREIFVELNCEQTAREQRISSAGHISQEFSDQMVAITRRHEQALHQDLLRALYDSDLDGGYTFEVGVDVALMDQVQ